MRNPSHSGGRSAAITLLLSFGLTGAALAAPVRPILPQEEQKQGPWRLATALGTPDWFEISGTVRGRYETFDKQFRTGAGGYQDVFVTRSIVAATLRDTYLSATAEIIDSRVYSGVSDARLNTTIVNAVELLQAYLAADFTDTFEPGDKLRVQFGRHTMDVGSRRLVARNRYRNTINAFTGINAQWESQAGTKVRAFYTLPVQRLPGSAAALRDNEIEFDEEHPSTRFYGVHAELKDVALGANAEFYGYGLLESDGVDFNSRDRNLKTIGTRWNKKRATSEVHWEIESAYQFGESPSSETQTLDHEAWFHHAMVGYEFDAEGKPRLEALFDYVTGDNDPNDDQNNRFDTLFGARRFEFGPTGIFGAFARSNLVSPGLRFVTKPADRWEVMATQRFHYLASDRDAWTTSGLQDPAGRSGSHIGNFSEVRLRYDLIPKSVLLEFGVAYLSAGSFIEDAPNATDQGDTLYGYFQTNFTF
ncbi:hypothetical protein Poly30_52860 [Planctomycetes bacterium Poly30]|uniref:Alginate export domain-containing protein n=1 Tax=Saltatorellus ferox TaxID=2528018 RepID=A0A518F064_9BACT|nr:hypothetical protein Poly30_52860 [Planctomycetes bacterium Poly30]